MHGVNFVHDCCPAPHGAGGLKSVYLCGGHRQKASRPAWGGWIEIFWQIILFLIGASRPAWGGWIEIPEELIEALGLTSRPAWGGWIEMAVITFFAIFVASRPAWGGWIEIYLPT